MGGFIFEMYTSKIILNIWNKAASERMQATVFRFRNTHICHMEIVNPHTHTHTHEHGYRVSC